MCVTIPIYMLSEEPAQFYSGLGLHGPKQWLKPEEN